MTKLKWWMYIVAAVYLILHITNLALVAASERNVSSSLDEPLEFEDDFETNKGWGTFEEIVNESDCYGTGIGEAARSTDVSFDGLYSLRVWANMDRSLKSNHVINQKRISNSGHTGRWRYEVYAYIYPETDGQGQTGPEFSLQNTREIPPGEFRTTTAGMQYIATPFAEQGQWNIWIEDEDKPGTAKWVPFTNQLLEPEVWYYIAEEVDFVTNRYIRFELRGGGLDVSIDLSGNVIAEEAKFNEEAFWLSVEAENLYNPTFPRSAT